MPTPATCHILPALLIATALCSLALGAPCTLYKPHTIANAKANIEKHKWAADILASWQKREQLALSKDREFFRQMVPDLTPWSTYGQVCPACVGEGCSPGETGVLQWSVSDPEKLTCKYCKTQYPNPKYPETGVLKCPTMGRSSRTTSMTSSARIRRGPGSTRVQVERGGRCRSATGVIRDDKLGWVMSQVPYLAKITLSPATWAAHSAWLDTRATRRVFPSTCTHSYGGCFADCEPAEAAREMGRNRPAGKFPGVICHPAAIMRDRNKDGFGDLDAGFWGAGRLSTGASGRAASCWTSSSPMTSPGMQPSRTARRSTPKR